MKHLFFVLLSVSLCLSGKMLCSADDSNGSPVTPSTEIPAADSNAPATDSTDQTADSVFTFEKNETAVILKEAGKPVWQYNFAMIRHENVPENEPRLLAGCYLHPLYGFHQEILTDNAPQDHYHHHGIFWTWPHVILHQATGDVEYDLWTSNTALRQHLVRFQRQSVDRDSAIFAVENGWFVGPVTYDNQGNIEETPIMKEFVEIRTSPAVTRDGITGRILDFCLTLIPTDTAITLRGAENKSYGGFTVRFRPFGQKGKSDFITTSAGIAEDDMPEKPLEWADYTSWFDPETQNWSGATIFIAPDHPDYPPTWLTRFYGPLCVGWPGVIGQRFEPGQEIRLKYRLWIHDGKVSFDQINKIFQEYKDGFGK